MGRIWNTKQQLLKQLTPLLNSRINLPHLRLEGWKVRQELKILWQGESSKSQDELQWCNNLFWENQILQNRVSSSSSSILQISQDHQVPSPKAMTSAPHRTHLPLAAALTLVSFRFFLLTIFLCAVFFILIMVPTVIIFQSEWEGKTTVPHDWADSCLSNKATRSDEPPCNQPEVTQVTGNEVPTKEGKGSKKATGRIKQNENAHQLIC